MGEEEKSTNSSDWYLNSIPTKKEEAVHMAALAIRWNTTTRGVRKIVEDLRNAGNIIITNEDGYYVATDVEEVKEFYKKTRAKAIGTLKNASLIRKYLVDNGAW